MGMRSFYKLKDMLCQELDEIAEKGELGAGDLDIAHKLTDTVKNIYKIEMLTGQQYSRDSYPREGYARGGDWNANIRGNYGRENSYRRGHYVRGHYSNDDGRDQLKEKLEGMAQGADEKTREVLMRAMEMLGE